MIFAICVPPTWLLKMWFHVKMRGRRRRPSAAVRYHSRTSSANSEISTLPRRVPTSYPRIRP
ncbi:hypothetical protein EMO90_00020 [Bifidobacterium vespertilionis]|uniref:Uncharacterized protein n=1 Tax=Bifidobacterium vespertilionis TaxID=2562524 RepID=A0A5J5E5W3_9BIFI|nr:hypothetical protein EMO90_00020 [Bifidobacterium vespertilionis]KAA8824513.1 hypothetical protein EM848_01505 [Bifidobacterium vespertilionis]